MTRRALVIGAGPAGLMAAEELARAGCHVTVAEAKPSPARKFLMAGKSGLNLTKDEPFQAFCNAFAPTDPLRPILDAFGPEQVQAWARGLGQELFTGSTGRVFPKAMKASPLMRAWMSRLNSLGVTLNTRWRWTGWDGAALLFDTPDGPLRTQADVTLLALGGASWSRLGSDGHWATLFQDAGLPTTPFQPANMGFRVNWSPHMTRHFGQPVKSTALIAGATRHRGEFVISERGLEGGGIYTVSRALREGATLALDLAPDLSRTQVAARLARPRGKASLSNHLRKTLRLDPVRQALLMEFAKPLPMGPDLVDRIKHLPIPMQGPRPLDEAISTAGGVAWASLDQTLMLTQKPGTFCAGEMLDWEAPTGGYLLTACLATGAWAGRHAANWR